MPSFQDSAILILLALLLFGPKKLPVLARQLGKLMADFRRASNEFRTQMEEELRISEQAERQKQIAAIEAAAPTTPVLPVSTPDPSTPDVPTPDAAVDPDQPYPADSNNPASTYEYPPEYPIEPLSESAPEANAAPVPIATSGELSILPPSTGLPVANSSSAAAPESASTSPAAAARQAELETETLHG
jgi:sec-independent protein translocase protein TatB